MKQKISSWDRIQKNVDETKNVPSKTLIAHLLEKGTFVEANNPKTDERFDAQVANDSHTSIMWADIIILAVGHSEYLSELPRKD